MSNKVITVFTDGSCVPNPGNGGWAYVEHKGDSEIGIYSCGYEHNTTNNRMEFVAAITAINDLAPECGELIICTDSELLVKTANDWLDEWVAKNKLHKKKNQDLLRQLHELLKKHKVTFRHVRGHSGNFHNSVADEMAKTAAQKCWQNDPT